MMRTAQLSLRVAIAAMLMAADVAFLDALTWGATPSAFAQLRRDGRARWLQAQLHPPAEPRLPRLPRKRRSTR
ncbi:hypothetical protein [Methylobacterium sp. ARG-1]|uniref:hypothetical protein n=1 Tax=Methylobacterium sp. ARG-1 TaxID=1692501 RepID=UPI000AD863A2|nr:hypothetical protein [Methylobacterium sp. ARG-1]